MTKRQAERREMRLEGQLARDLDRLAAPKLKLVDLCPAEKQAALKRARERATLRDLVAKERQSTLLNLLHALIVE